MVEKSIREEAFRRADRLHCSAAATLILAGDRNGWPQDRVDELRPLFGALLPSIDDLDEKFGKGYFARNLPPADQPSSRATVGRGSGSRRPREDYRCAPGAE